MKCERCGEPDERPNECVVEVALVFLEGRKLEWPAGNTRIMELCGTCATVLELEFDRWAENYVAELGRYTAAPGGQQ